MHYYDELALPYQKSLIFAALDDFSASDLLGGVYGGQFGDEMPAWKSAVICFLRRNISSGLIEPSVDAFEDVLNAHEILSAFSNSDPNGNPEVWMGIQFHGTEKLTSNIASHGMLGWEHVKSPLNRETSGQKSKCVDTATSSDQQSVLFTLLRQSRSMKRYLI